MPIRVIVEVLYVVSFYIYITNLSAKPVSIANNMTVASGTNTLSHVIHAKSDEPSRLEGPKTVQQDTLERSMGG